MMILFLLVLKLEISYEVMISWRIFWFLLEDFFNEDYIFAWWNIILLSFALRYFFNVNGKATLSHTPCFGIEYSLMITLPTHECHKSSFQHSKTIYVFTSGQVIISVQIHSRKKVLEGVKMTTAKWTINTGEQQDLHYPAARFNKNGCVCPCGGGDALRDVPLCNPACFCGTRQNPFFALCLC